PWLAEKKVDFLKLRKKLSVMKTLGVPYTDEQLARADLDAEADAKIIAENLRQNGIEGDKLEQKEIVALIAYLQALGQKAKAEESKERNKNNSHSLLTII